MHVMIRKALLGPGEDGESTCKCKYVRHSQQIKLLISLLFSYPTIDVPPPHLNESTPSLHIHRRPAQPLILLMGEEEWMVMGLFGSAFVEDDIEKKML